MPVTLSPIKITDIIVSSLQLLRIAQTIMYAFNFFKFMVLLDPLLNFGI